MAEKRPVRELADQLATEAMFFKEGDLPSMGRAFSMLEGADPEHQEVLAPLKQLLGRLMVIAGEEFTLVLSQLNGMLEALQAGKPLPVAQAQPVAQARPVSSSPAPQQAQTVKQDAPPPAQPPAEKPQAEKTAAAAEPGAALTQEPAAPPPQPRTLVVPSKEEILSEMDSELFMEFVEEGLSHLQSIELDILELETDSTKLSIIDNIFRPFHTIKGVAGFLALHEIHQVCHDLENLMDDARKGRMQMTGEVSDLVLEAVDLLKRMIQTIHGKANPHGLLKAFQADVESLLAKVAVVRTHKGGGQAMAAPAPKPAAFGMDQTAFSLSGPASAPPLEESPVLTGLAEYDAPPAEAHPPGRPPAQVPVEPPIQAEPSVPPATSSVSEPSSSEPGSGGAAESIRVRINLLNQMMDLAGELVLGRNQLMQKVAQIKEEVPGLVSVVQHVDRVTSELQEAVMQTRMQPIGGLFSRYHRVIRDLARSLGKKIELQATGESVEMDKSLIEAITDPLTHLIRNAADHGIEPPQDRKANGKPETGTVILEAYQEGGKVRVKVADDGRGVNLERVKQKGLEKGLITHEQAQAMTERELLQLLFEPGFSTAEQVTGVSGRGVGMDVVRMNIERIGGIIEVVNHPGKGTTFYLDLPLTLAIVPALIVTAAEERFAIPQINLLELVHLEGVEAVEAIMRVRGSEVFRLRGEMLPLLRLGGVLDIARHSRSGEHTSVYIVVLAAGKTRFGLMVDAIYDTEEIVVKPLGNLLKNTQVFAGATLMGDGRPALILDVAGLARISNMSLGEEHGVTSVKEAGHAGEHEEQAVLLFSVGKDEQFAVPLPLISRLEEVEAKRIQHAINGNMIEYRGRLLPLVFMENHVPIAKPREGREKVTVLVFEIERDVGLVVSDIIDSVHMNVQLDEKSLVMNGFNGMALVNGKPTAFVDIYQLIEMAYPDWFKTNRAKRQKVFDPSEITILLAEDSNFYRIMEKNYLTQEGFNVVDVEDGKRALDYLKRNKVDLVVTDIEMPNMDGFQLTQAIRNSDGFKELPVIAVTSLAQEEDRQKGIKAGVDAYLVKLHKEQLIKEVQRLLQN